MCGLTIISVILFGDSRTEISRRYRSLTDFDLENIADDFTVHAGMMFQYMLPTS